MKVSRLACAFLATVLSLPVVGGERAPYIPTFSCTEGALGLRLPKELPQLMRMARVIRQEEALPVKWDGNTTTERAIYFPGLSLVVITSSTEPKRYLLKEAEISSPQWVNVAPFYVGETIESARKKLGRAAKNDTALSYTYGSEGGDLSFDVSSGKITKVTYVCYTG